MSIENGLESLVSNNIYFYQQRQSSNEIQMFTVESFKQMIQDESKNKQSDKFYDR